MTLAKCRDCGQRTDRVVPVGDRHEWLCASCEYLRLRPDAPMAVKPPRERTKRLQRETLFDASRLSGGKG